MAQHPGPGGDDVVLPLYGEDVSVARRKVARGGVRVHVQTKTREHVVDEVLTHEQVEIERVPIGRHVASVPPVREEGDVTVVPVVEEVIIIERRLVLKEEIRLRRVRTTERHRETVVLREQEAMVERTVPDIREGLPPPDLSATPQPLANKDADA